MKQRPDSSNLQNYLAIIGIVPAVISIMAYEFLDFVLFKMHPERNDYDPINGLGILVPMALMTELFTYFFSKHLLKKVNLITAAINRVGQGDYSIVIKEKHMAPLKDVVLNFNKMTKDLQSVETLRSDFINDFSHEFKTPIASINGFANLLLDTNVTEDERKEYLQIIADESMRLTHLAEQTMLMSKLDTQASIPDKKNYCLDEQIKQNIILLSKDWTDKDILMDINLEPVTYFGNPSIMTHIWINLLNNAIKFTPKHGTINISLSKKGSDICFRITNSGTGMTEEQMKYIFNKYYQTDKSHATKGLGLGLSIVSRIVDLCDGKISVESKQNVSSTFTIILHSK